SHIWLIWQFSEAVRDSWSPTVRPPRLGGNERMGVFATRSPFRPNPLGLSSVELLRMEKRPGLGTVLVVAGADLMDGSPIYDIKPYLSFTDSHPEAKNGFAADHAEDRLPVEFPPEFLDRIPEEKRPALLAALSLDPRPGYLTGRSDPYGFPYAGKDVRFYVEDGVVKVFDVVEES
ncbi:MAG: tRNA (N6-threonylcarbamoyladenosine(37)-N6)-methyltransferase TrmO, partial [Clostridia bacterium]|nr:tRNA (N6-threonylcarbamoyladenosine(37)-N6)-methyltransferase TrmO [Clostridia bacterium]